MKAVDICKRPVITTVSETTLAEVAKIMRKEHVGSVVVVDSTSAMKPVGIVTDRDIVIEVVASGLDPEEMTAGEVMTLSPAVAHRDDDVMWALKVMRDRGVRRLPVVDENNQVSGILALDDVMQHMGTALYDIAQLIGSERLVEGWRRP